MCVVGYKLAHHTAALSRPIAPGLWDCAAKSFPIIGLHHHNSFTLHAKTVRSWSVVFSHVALLEPVPTAGKTRWLSVRIVENLQIKFYLRKNGKSLYWPPQFHTTVVANLLCIRLFLPSINLA